MDRTRTEREGREQQAGARRKIELPPGGRGGGHARLAEWCRFGAIEDVGHVLPRGSSRAKRYSDEAARRNNGTTSPSSTSVSASSTRNPTSTSATGQSTRL